MIDDFSYDFTWYTRSVELLSGFVEKLKKWASANPLTFFKQLTAGKTFHRGAEKPRGARMPPLYQVFNHRFK